MDAKIEAIMHDVAENWPYKDVAKKSLSSVLDRTLAALAADQRAQAILTFLRNSRPENKHEYQRVIQQVLDFEQLWFFQRIWRYLTTDIAQVLGLYRISDLFYLQEDLNKEGNLCELPFKEYQRRSQGLSWFARLITPTIPGLKTALSEAHREYKENCLLDEKNNNETYTLRSNAVALYIDIRNIVRNITRYSNYKAYLENTLQWQGGSAKPVWEDQECWQPSIELKKFYGIDTLPPELRDAEDLCEDLPDNYLTQWWKSQLVYKALLKDRVAELQESLNSAKEDLLRLKNDIEILRPDVQTHIQNIDRIEHEKFIEEMRQKALDTEDFELKLRMLISKVEIEAHRPSSLP